MDEQTGYRWLCKMCRYRETVGEKEYRCKKRIKQTESCADIFRSRPDWTGIKE